MIVFGPDWVLPLRAQLRARELAQLEEVVLFVAGQVLPRHRSSQVLDGRHEMQVCLIFRKFAAFHEEEQGNL